MKVQNAGTFGIAKIEIVGFSRHSDHHGYLAG